MRSAASAFVLDVSFNVSAWTHITATELAETEKPAVFRFVAIVGPLSGLKLTHITSIGVPLYQRLRLSKEGMTYPRQRRPTFPGLGANQRGRKLRYATPKARTFNLMQKSRCVHEWRYPSYYETKAREQKNVNVLNRLEAWLYRTVRYDSNSEYQCHKRTMEMLN